MYYKIYIAQCTYVYLRYSDVFLCLRSVGAIYMGLIAIY